MGRHIEERAEFPNGIKMEWEPSPVRVVGKDKEVRAQVRELNKKARAEGSFLRYRSVEDEQ